MMPPDDPPEEDLTVPEECANCDGEGIVPGCAADTCDCGHDDDPHLCCAPARCDWCKGRG